MPALNHVNRTNFVSFSGIDGAGKSTQIEALRTLVERDGRRVIMIRFWDDIARLARLRETTGHKVFKGEKGIGTPSAPINRRDKNVQSLPMTIVRLFIYFLDALSVRNAVKMALQSGADLVIFDRYIYDELANLALSRWPARAFTRFLLKLVPAPDLAFVIDADPVAAQARKPEYPLAFVRRNRDAYLELSTLARNISVLGPASIDTLRATIKNEVGKRLTTQALATRTELLSSAS